MLKVATDQYWLEWVDVVDFLGQLQYRSLDLPDSISLVS